ncbi:MAG: hypothetical protein WEA80_09450 [Gemmatimonadaceae bacterium]
MTIARVVAIAAIAAIAQGCALAAATGGADGGALAPTQALDAGDFVGARTLLQARAKCTGSTQGREALLLLTSLELDPRNPSRSPAAALAHARLYLRLPGEPPVRRALARAFYVIGLEMSGDAAAAVSRSSVSGRRNASATPATGVSARVRGKCPTVASDRLLPFEPLSLPVQTVHTRLRASEEARRAIEKQLADLAAELDRILEILRQ